MVRKIIGAGQSGIAATGDSSHFGTQDLDYVNQLLTGAVQSDAVTINTNTTFGSGKLIATSPSISGSGGALTLPAGPETIVGRATTDTLTNKTADGELNTFPNIVSPSSYMAYIAGSTIKVRNTKTGTIDFSGTDATTVLNNCLAAIRNTGRRLTLLGNTTFSLSGSLNLDLYQSLAGESALGLARLHANGNYPAVVIKQTVSGAAQNVELANLYITHAQTTYSDGLVSLQSNPGTPIQAVAIVDIHNCYFYDFGKNVGNAIRFSNNSAPMYKIRVYDCEMYGFQDQVYVTFAAGDSNSWITTCTFSAIHHWNPNNSSMTVSSPSGALWGGNHYINCFTQSVPNTQTGYDFNTSMVGNGWYNYFTNCLIWDLTAGRNAWLFNGICEVTMLGCQPDFRIGGTGATNSKVIKESIYSFRYGNSTQSGNGSTTAFNIAHGLSATPTTVNIMPGSAAANSPFYVTVGSTNITVNYTSAPASGTNNLTWYWQARV